MKGKSAYARKREKKGQNTLRGGSERFYHLFDEKGEKSRNGLSLCPGEGPPDGIVVFSLEKIKDINQT